MFFLINFSSALLYNYRNSMITVLYLGDRNVESI